MDVTGIRDNERRERADVAKSRIDTRTYKNTCCALLTHEITDGQDSMVWDQSPDNGHFSDWKELPDELQYRPPDLIRNRVKTYQVYIERLG